MTDIKKVLVSLTEEELEIIDKLKKSLWVRSRSGIIAFLVRSFENEKSSRKSKDNVDFKL